MKKSIWILFLAILWVGLPTGKALAHAELETSTPASGASVSDPVKEVTLTFSEGIQPISTLTVHDSSHREIKPAGLSVNGKTLTATFGEPLADGAYTVDWHNVSDDGHAEEGTFSFTVGAASSGTATGAQPPQSQGQAGLRTYAPIAAGVLAIVIVLLLILMLKPKRKQG